MKDNIRFVTKGLSGLNLLRAETHAYTCKGYSSTWFIVMLLVVLMAGCNGTNPSLGGGGTGPTVSSTAPADGATGVAINTNITATFSEAMDSSTINRTTFTVAAGATDVSGTVTLSADSLTATFDPASDLEPSTDYTVTLTRRIKDLSGNALPDRKVWTFTTGTAADTTPPVVSFRNPVNGTTGVLVTATISATFSEAMQASTITTDTFTVTETDLTPVTGIVAYNATTKIATFTPTGGLAPSTQYIATITTGVKDLAGNAMVANDDWIFTTGL